MNKRTRFVCVAVLLTALAVPAWAGMNFVPTTYGLSARAMSMGNAMTATRSDLSMAFANPAALGALDHSRVGLGYLYGVPTLHTERDGDGLPDVDDVNDVVMINAAFSLRNVLTKGKRGIGFGLSFTADDNGKTFIDFTDRRSDSGQFLRYGNSNTALLAGLGVEIMPWLMIGAGATIQLEAEVRMEITTDLEGNTKNESFDQVAEFVFSPNVGVLAPWKEWTFGATWRGESIGQVGPITAPTAAEVGGAALTTLPIKVSFRDSFLPMQLAVGASWEGGDGLLVALDVTWYQWSRFDEVIEDNDSARYDADISFADTYVPRAGVEYILGGVHAFRAGYSYEMSPVTDIGTVQPDPDGTTVGFVVLDNDKHVASVGYGYTLYLPEYLSFPIGFDLAFQGQFLPERTEDTSDGVEFVSDGFVYAGGLTISLGF